MIDGKFLPPVNFARIPPEQSRFDDASVVIVPVPYDATTEWHNGSQKGPQAIIAASEFLELYDTELDNEPYLCGIHTLCDVKPCLGGPADMLARVRSVTSDVLQAGKMPFMLGGEHSLTVGAVQAVADRFEDLTVLQLDAHADLRDEYMGTGLNHACVMRRVADICPFVQVGVRSMCLEERRYLSEKDVRTSPATGGPLTEADFKRIGSGLSRNLYITIDLDVLDPSVMPAVALPEPGGIGWCDLLRLLRAVVRGRRVVGVDVVELCPREGGDASAYLAAKLVYKMIGYICEGKRDSAKAGTEDNR